MVYCTGLEASLGLLSGGKSLLMLVHFYIFIFHDCVDNLKISKDTNGLIFYLDFHKLTKHQIHSWHELQYHYNFIFVYIHIYKQNRLIDKRKTNVSFSIKRLATSISSGNLPCKRKTFVINHNRCGMPLATI